VGRLVVTDYFWTCHCFSPWPSGHLDAVAVVIHQPIFLVLAGFFVLTY
jgi:hypothetical protein